MKWADRERNELAEYINLKVSKNTYLIQFWLDNKSILPNLYTMARQVLYVPASSAASKRLFSTAGRMLEKRCEQSSILAQQYGVNPEKA